MTSDNLDRGNGGIPDMIRRAMTQAAHALRNHVVLFYCASLLSFILTLYLFNHEINDGSFKLHTLVVRYLGEGMLLLLPYWLIPDRWKGSVLIPVWFSALFMTVNLWYFRFFKDLIPASSYLMSGNFDLLLLNSIRGVWNPTDIIFLMTPAILTASYFLYFRKKIVGGGKSLISNRLKMYLVLFSSIMTLLCQLAMSSSARKWLSGAGYEVSLSEAFLFRFSGYSANINAYRFLGYDFYTMSTLAEVIMPDDACIELSDDEVRKIDGFIAGRTEKRLCKATDSLLSRNRDKNLVLIIVESLNADVIGAVVNGTPVTPTLNSLIKVDGTVSCTNMIPQVKSGGSSDGQMLYNTGLLPAQNYTAAMRFGDNTFLSIANTIPFRTAFEVIGEEQSMWNHRTTSASYGYGALYDRDSIDAYGFDPSATGSDAAIFGLAIQKIKDAPQPFFAEITTLSMHIPFHEDAVPMEKWVSAADGMTASARNYINITHYFDNELGKFIQQLKDCRKYDNTIIVIASDHHCHALDDIFDVNDIRPIVFIALNTGISERIERTVGQIDVFPTIVDMMGRGNTAQWRGLGISMLDRSLNSAVDQFGDVHGEAPDADITRQKEAWLISDLIIRGNYFARP